MNLLKHNRSGGPGENSLEGKNRGPMGVLPTVLILAVTLVGSAFAEQKSVRDQIDEAVSPLKSYLRERVTVRGYVNGEVVVLRQGTSPLVCLADNPRDRRFQVSCYSESLEPFMARGRELRAEGKRGPERQRIRNAEIDAGLIEMPSRASVISLYGIGPIKARTGWPDSVTTLQVLYLPYATAEETGFPDRPSRSSAYLMDAGTARAHLMIPGNRRKFRPHDPMRRR